MKTRRDGALLLTEGTVSVIFDRSVLVATTYVCAPSRRPSRGASWIPPVGSASFTRPSRGPPAARLALAPGLASPSLMLARARAPTRARASPPRGSPRPPGPSRARSVASASARPTRARTRTTPPPRVLLVLRRGRRPRTPPRARPHPTPLALHDDDLEDASDAVTTEHGSPWRDFVLACTGDWAVPRLVRRVASPSTSSATSTASAGSPRRTCPSARKSRTG